MKRRMLFHRDFLGYSGGHGKVWDYYCHAEAHPAWEPRVYFTPRSIAEGNPWGEHGIDGEPGWYPQHADALFLGGMDWLALPSLVPPRPVLNIVQHVRHADPDDPRYRFLARPATRICVSEAVAAAILDTGRVNGPVLTIPAGLSLPDLDHHDRPRTGILIAALKQPTLGQGVASALREQGCQVELLIGNLPRREFLLKLASSEVAVTLPMPREGFFLPALEAMAMGCATVVPDCIGNREYCRDGENALVPPLQTEAIVAAASRLSTDPVLRTRLSSSGKQTANRFSLARERETFHALLDTIA